MAEAEGEDEKSEIEIMIENINNFDLPPGPLKGEDIKAPAVLHSTESVLYRDLKRRAKEMRYNPTPAEAKLWNLLSNNQLGVKFRRQHPIAKYIVDFYCIEKALVIEVDGNIHDLFQEHDEYREGILASLGCCILRFTNEQVLNEPHSLVKIITHKINSL